ncbi:cytochrome C [Sulfurovum lithotrophicum]|uniref:Cytochrome C n=1 Tax=Sulfurovum lithotrophicum TaxID=206403 RepID=A0A7U4M189_9BACT|nr:heme-binding domain-containing protein [Sulfurovum lithotrophicum]AKF24962.1 cytochrome C [Sulfurovum lithotrophicum]
MFKIILAWLFGALILIQAIQISIPKPEKVTPDEEIKAPAEIMKMLKTSCYDCHSYETKMPWYGNIAPLSWEVKSHIKEGREWLNFQTWDRYDDEKKQKLYKGIAKTINFSMPMPMYLSLHKEAKLSREQRRQIKEWAESNIKEDY